MENQDLNSQTQEVNESNLQTRDVADWRRLNKAIAKRKKSGQPFDRLAQKLVALENKSKEKTEANLISENKLSIPHELPIAQKQEEIISLLKTNQVIVVAGETGCGKTTQLPKLCAMAGLGARGQIAHTQPRRVAATSVAKRIAEEMNVQLGEEVGYSIRFNKKSGPKTRIKLMTDGVLLTELETDPWLSKYEVIIIDEAHERSLNIDFLIGFIRRILTRRKDLKIIITSATIDPEKFSASFNNAPIVLVEGRSYPVEVRYRPIEDEENTGNDDPILLGIQNAVDECYAESSGNILVFADGEGQIKSIIKHLQKMNLSQTEILPLYARLSISEQQRIFAQSGKRKIIVSTNVAETSLTVPGIIFVIDIGHARISRFSQRNKIQQLPVEKVSRASADQRKGRCGRIAPGICIRLYSEEDFTNRPEFTLPEIKRTNLSSVLLRLKASGVEQVDDFPFIDAPSDRAWKTAYNSLYELGAIDESDAITAIGKLMSRLPVDPQLARILAQPDLTAVDQMLIICSLMSVKEVRMRPHDKQNRADELHRQYDVETSDILTAIKLWNTLEKQKAELSSSQFKTWCSKNLINFLGWLEWRRVYFQLKEAVDNEGIKINKAEVHADDIHAALIPGFITHIFQKTQERHYQGVRGLKVWLHPSSLKFKKGGSWLLSVEMIETEKLYARMNCEIKPEWIEKYAGHLVKSNYQEPHWRKNTGQVVAYLSQTLLGLPIVNRRLVNFGNIDPAAARTIFLLEGLAKDNLKADFPFVLANRKKLHEIEETEHKHRESSIKIDSERLAQLYGSNIPEHVVSLPGLRKWLKKDFKQRNKMLTFSLQELSSRKVSDEEAYPAVITVKGVELKLEYAFAPGTEQDGITVIIPDAMLSQFNERDFDWLVPGFLEEKVLAAIKSLPKATRKKLIPLKETAERCTKELNLKYATKDLRFVDALAKVLQRDSGQQIKITDFDLENISPHLKMKFKLLSTQGGKKQQTISSVWPEIQSVKVSNKPVGNRKITSWDFNEFRIEQVNKESGVVTRKFSGLVDCTTFVQIQAFPSQSIAASYHQLGVGRLVLLDNKSMLNRLYRGWPEKANLERLCIRNGGFQELFDGLCQSLCNELINSLESISRKDFSRLSEKFAEQVHRFLANKLTEILPLIKLREKAFAEIGDLNEKVFSASIKDIRSQLESLWLRERIANLRPSFSDDYSRYHKGILARIKRIRENYPKEADALDVWLDWLDWWTTLEKSANHNIAPNSLDELFWALEEYRLSLFSPGVKVKGGVSAKKLQKEFEAIEAKL